MPIHIKSERRQGRATFTNAHLSLRDPGNAGCQHSKTEDSVRSHATQAHGPQNLSLQQNSLHPVLRGLEDPLLIYSCQPPHRREADTTAAHLKRCSSYRSNISVTKAPYIVRPSSSRQEKLSSRIELSRDSDTRTLPTAAALTGFEEHRYFLIRRID